MTDPLERSYRRLLAFYPDYFRRENGEELIAVLLDTAREGQRRPSVLEAANLLQGAARLRLRVSHRPRPRPGGHPQRQFHFGARPTNLDRCDWCGEARSAHGADWACPAASRLGRAPLVALATGIVLAVAGFILYIDTPGLSQIQENLDQLGGILLLFGLTTAVTAAVLLQRLHAAQARDLYDREHLADEW